MGIPGFQTQAGLLMLKWNQINELFTGRLEQN
jgi:hypothetical protein